MARFVSSVSAGKTPERVAAAACGKGLGPLDSPPLWDRAAWNRLTLGGLWGVAVSLSGGSGLASQADRDLTAPDSRRACSTLRALTLATAVARALEVSLSLSLMIFLGGYLEKTSGVDGSYSRGSLGPPWGLEPRTSERGNEGKQAGQP